MRMSSNMYVATFYFKKDLEQRTIYPPIVIVGGTTSEEKLPSFILTILRTSPEYSVDHSELNNGLCLKEIYGKHLPDGTRFSDEKNKELHDLFVSRVGTKNTS